MSLAVVILAAGKGTRMRSRLPKVLHPLAGRPMLQHVIDSARALEPSCIIVVHGHGGDQVKAAIPGDDLTWVEQAEQLGTGHAVAQAMPAIREDRVLVLYGDVPLTRPETLERFAGQADDGNMALMTLTLDDPGAYGRIVRNEADEVMRIVEFKDASDEEKGIQEINTGILAAATAWLNEALPALSAENAQGEYYLTDVIAMAVDRGMGIRASQPSHSWEVDGINDRVQLARLERIYQGLLAEELMRGGVSLADPSRIDIRGELQCDEDVSIDVNCVFEGSVRLGSGTRIGANCVLIDCELGDDVTVLANSHLEGVNTADAVSIGPFARLRPGTEMATGSKVGNFVETKKAIVGEGSKINHLTYVGDTRIGRNVNVGAGTITCNYDGVNKFQTVLEDDAFIGSNSSLVAPVTVGRGATVGAGSTINRDVPDHQLAVARGKQRNIEGWKRPVKKD